MASERTAAWARDAAAVDLGDASTFAHPHPRDDEDASDAALRRALLVEARATLDAFVGDGTLTKDDEPTYYFYGQKMGDHEQTGILAACSVAEYDAGGIKKHEFTRPDKEDDRTHHMEVLDAQVGLVFLAYRASERLADLTAAGTAGEPAWRVTTEDGVEHALWPERSAHLALKRCMSPSSTAHTQAARRKSACSMSQSLLVRSAISGPFRRRRGSVSPMKHGGEASQQELTCEPYAPPTRSA